MDVTEAELPHHVAGGPEIFFGFPRESDNDVGSQVEIRVVRGNGTRIQTIGVRNLVTPSLGDLDGDGGLDLIVGKPVESVDDFGSAGAVYLILGVRPNNPPIANAGSDQTVAVGPDCMATVSLDGSGSTDPDGHPLTYAWIWDDQSATGINPSIELPLGTSTITLIVNDGIEDSEPDTVTITVIDDTPPEINVSVSPDTLWPPNHKMVLCTPTTTVSDNCDPSPNVVLLPITTNEGGESDIQIHGNGDIYLRCERSGTISSRIYTITYTVTDASGNSATSSVTVTVPHDQRKPKPMR